MKQHMIDPKSARVFHVSQNQGTPKAGPGIAKKPSHEEVARRAHEIYVESGREPGHSEENWERAEGDLRRVAQETRIARQEMQNEGGASQTAKECSGETPRALAGGDAPIRSGAVSPTP